MPASAPRGASSAGSAGLSVPEKQAADGSREGVPASEPEAGSGQLTRAHSGGTAGPDTPLGTTAAAHQAAALAGAAPPPPAFPSHHAGPFSALAALLAGSMQRAGRGGASFAHVDVLLPGDSASGGMESGGSHDIATAAGAAAAQPEPPAACPAAGTAGPAVPPGAPPAEAGRQAGGGSEQQAALPPLHNVQQPVLLLEDDAAGLSPAQLRRSLGVPPRANTASGSVAAGPSSRRAGAGSGSGSPGSPSALEPWPDFVHAALRLGSAALVLSKRRDKGASVGLLRCVPAPQAGDGGPDAPWLEAAVIDFGADDSRQLASTSQTIAPSVAAAPSAAAAAWRTAAVAATASAAGTAWQAGLEAISGGWPGGASEEQLRQQLAGMLAQGVRVLVAGLRTKQQPADEAAAGADAAAARPALAHELDWSSDPSDLRVEPSAPDAEAQQGQQAQQAQQQEGDPGVQRCLALRQSLRAYMAVLFLRWPEGFRLRLRGRDVQHQLVKDWLKWPATDEYRPRGVRDEVDEHGFQMQHVVQVNLGFLLEAPNTSMQARSNWLGGARDSMGVCVYSGNRLVKPFWNVSSASAAGRGVVGYLDASFLEVTPDWQDFQRTHVLSKLEAFLKRSIPAYWKKHAHLLSASPGTALLDSPAPRFMPGMPPLPAPHPHWQALRPSFARPPLVGGPGQAMRPQGQQQQLLPFLAQGRMQQPGTPQAGGMLQLAAAAAALQQQQPQRPVRGPPGMPRAATGQAALHRPQAAPGQPDLAPLHAQQAQQIQQQLSLLLASQQQAAPRPGPPAPQPALPSAALAAAVQLAQQNLWQLQQQFRAAHQQEQRQRQEQELLLALLPLLGGMQPGTSAQRPAQGQPQVQPVLQAQAAPQPAPPPAAVLAGQHGNPTSALLGLLTGLATGPAAVAAPPQGLPAPQQQQAVQQAVQQQQQVQAPVPAAAGQAPPAPPPALVQSQALGRAHSLEDTCLQGSPSHSSGGSAAKRPRRR